MKVRRHPGGPRWSLSITDGPEHDVTVTMPQIVAELMPLAFVAGLAVLVGPVEAARQVGFLLLAAAGVLIAAIVHVALGARVEALARARRRAIDSRPTGYRGARPDPPREGRWKWRTAQFAAAGVTLALSAVALLDGPLLGGRVVLMVLLGAAMTGLLRYNGTLPRAPWAVTTLLAPPLGVALGRYEERTTGAGPTDHDLAQLVPVRWVRRCRGLRRWIVERGEPEALEALLCADARNETRAAFRALVATDPERASRLLEASARHYGRLERVTRTDLAPLLNHPDEAIRERVIAALGHAGGKAGAA